MSGDLVNELRESAGLPVGKARPAAKTASEVRALRPQDCLHPLAELFGRSSNRAEFLQILSDYIRLLIGAELVALHEKGEDGLRLAGFASAAEGGAAVRKSWLPSSEILEKSWADRRSSQAHVLIDNRQHARLMVPFFVQDKPPVCITAFLPPERIAFSDPCFSMLHLTTQFIVQRELLADSHEKELAFVQATMLVEMFSRTADGDTFKRSLFSLVTELEKFFGCQRVAIGTGSSRSCKVHAVSGMSSEEKRTLGLSQLGAAMREAIALDEIMVWPGQKEMVREVVVSANHDDLLHSFKSGRIVVAPLRHEVTGVTGAIALLWPAGSPEVAKRTYRLLDACQPHLASLVGFLKRSKHGEFRGGLSKFWRQSKLKRVALVSGIVALITAMLFPVTYRVSAQCVIQPVLRRTIAAPFENRLYRTYAKPGDEVEAGQILAELDGREIRVALAESIAARSAAVKRRDNAMVLEDPAELQMSQLEADRLSLEVERLQFRNDNLLIRSPIDGVVLTGNLERSEGVPVSTGQKLFEVAPLDKMLMEIAITETEIRHVEKEQEVVLRIESDSAKKRKSTLETLHPISEIQSGQNVFVAEAVLENEDGLLRPGMKGSVRILSEKKSVGWILFHRLWEYLRLKLW
ncbi:MAG: efflux RND transporter periplasmic adaptor subunit [Verrucomicrobiales bacterium]|nr:efflux RND transporter periplasmic adaptor subunit [Verrucomicrobiales bacterium]